jgi:hypothetical protein
MRTAYQIAVNETVVNALSERLSEVTVTQSLEAPAQFRATFLLENCDEPGGRVGILDDDDVFPMAISAATGGSERTLSVLVKVEDDLHCLIHGVVTAHNVTLVDGGPGSLLQIQGEDRSLVLRRTILQLEHHGRLSELASTVLQPRFDAIDVEESTLQYTHEPLRVTNQNVLAFLQQAGAREGFYLWVEASATSTEGELAVEDCAHFKTLATALLGSGPPPPTQLTRSPTRELAINTHTPRGITRYQIQAHAPEPRRVQPVYSLDARTGELTETTPEPDPRIADVARLQTELGNRLAEFELAEAEEVREQIHVAEEAMGIDEVAAANAFAISDAIWNVSLETETTLEAYGALIKPHTLLDVYGAGTTYTGRYVVKTVVHTINATSHKMALTLMGKTQNPT